ncbi:hypothetical protein C2S51_010474, partial [Perilla frutescens var. frutescens]
MVRRGVSPDVPPRFFKIMFGKDHSKLMYLPPEFARKVNHLTNQEIQIEDSCGQRWSVTLSRVNGSLAFQKGWQQFFLDHGLKVGHMLVFTYTEGSHFTVQIYTRSAVERTYFNNEIPRRRKRFRRDQGTSLEDEPDQTADANSGDKPISASLVSAGNEFQRLETGLAMENADLVVSQPPPEPMNIEDPICIINRDDVYHEEHRNLLYDLSSFEMENRISDANNSQKALITVSDPPHTETAHHDVNFEDAADKKISLSEIVEPIKTAGDDAMELTKTTMEDAEMAVIQTDLILDNSGDISINKFEKELDAKKALSHEEIADQITKEVDDTQIAPHSGQAGGHSCDAFVDRFDKEPSNNSNMKKGMLDNVCNFQDGDNHFSESFSVSPSIGSSKLAEREHAVKSKFGELSISSSAVKHPLGGPAVKKELVKMEDKAIACNEVSHGGKKAPVAMVWNHAQMISPPVKVEPEIEPDQFNETGPSDTCPFSAEVKSRVYLELPVPIIPSARGKKPRPQPPIPEMVVYLRDSNQKLWPVVYNEYRGRRAFTNNWTKFCEQNNINPGDRCRFHAEDNAMSYVYRVEVARGSSGESGRPFPPRGAEGRRASGVQAAALFRVQPGEVERKMRQTARRYRKRRPPPKVSKQDKAESSKKKTQDSDDDNWE